MAATRKTVDLFLDLLKSERMAGLLLVACTAISLLLTNAAQHSCPSAINTAWHSAEPRALQRPPRA